MNRILCLLAILFALPLAVRAEPTLELRNGDRVVFLGDTFVEREATDSFLETRLTALNAHLSINFRNLGWSADTVLGTSRASFDPVEKGFERLKEHLAAIKPTVVFLSHGMSSSFDGAEGLPKFKKDVATLIETIKSISGDNVRLVFLSPIFHENLGAPLPDGKAHNAQLKLYSDAIADIAKANNSLFVPLFDKLQEYAQQNPNRLLTDNGIHLTAKGYAEVARIITDTFSTVRAAASLSVQVGAPLTVNQTAINRLQLTATGASFRLVDGPLLELPPGGTRVDEQPWIQIRGLKKGKYALHIDGQTVAVAPASDWASGQRVNRGPGIERAAALRQAIVKKNQLYFYRWRPQNETYLFGFRKHEQGQNGREIPMFDPLVSTQENLIATLKLPKERLYELVEATAQDEKAVQPVTTTLAAKEFHMVPNSPQATPSFELDPEVEVSLFAESPELAKPIQMNFDNKGRLWVAGSSVYPQIKPGQEANDKILLLEDTDGDGKVDRSTVFAEGLLIPTGIAPGDGGVYVANSTELLHFKDTDGDGRADVRRVVLSGFGTEDTHHILHTLRWGNDGQLYMNQSIYIHSHVETPHGVVRLNSGGIWNFRADTGELGILAKGFVNSWGHHFDRYGQSFATDGAGGEGINWIVPQAMYVTYAGARRILSSVSPGSYPKFASLEVIESKQFPDSWQGSMITCDFRAHRVVRFQVNELDSGYVTKELPDLMRTTNVTFRPIDVKLGPDGALYIADWSNPIIQHGEVDFRDPRRDKENGRIWRVTAKGHKALPSHDFTKLATKELLNTLHSPNNYERTAASRTIVERGTAKVSSDLRTWTKQQTVDLDRLDALWIHQALDTVNMPLLQTVMASKDGRIRAAGARVLGMWLGRLKGAEQTLAANALLATQIKDSHPRARLEAIRIAAKFGGAQAAELVLGSLDLSQDRFLEYATWLSVNELADPWLTAVQDGTWKWQGREKQLAYGLKSIPPEKAAAVLSKVLPSQAIPDDGSGPWLELIGSSGGPSELDKVFNQLLKGGFNAGGTLKAYAALDQAARIHQTKPSGDLTALKTLFSEGSQDARAASVRLVGAWKLAEFTPDLLNLSSDPSAPASVKQAALQSVRDIGGSSAVESLKKLALNSPDIALRQQAVITLASIDLGQAGAPAAATLAAITKDEEALAFWRSLLTIKGMSVALTQALPRNGLPLPVAKAGLRAAREGGRSDAGLILALARNLDASGETQQLGPDELKAFMQNITAQGNPVRGEMIYRRTELGCITCHSIGGMGGKVGPDMTSIGASAPLDYLIESIQFPNRKVKEGYNSVQIETKDSLEISGILVRENGEQVVLRDASSQEVAVAKNNIQKRSMGGSLMPSGLIDGLSQADQTDLYRFLSELGKPGAFDASKSSTARSWKLLASTIDLAQFGDEFIVKQNMTEKGWAPASSLIDGRLLKSEFEASLKSIAWRNPDSVYAGTRLQIPKDGAVKLVFDNLGSSGLWVDGKPALTDGMPIQLKAGTHNVIVKVDGRKLPDHLRLVCTDGTFLTN